jgi:LPS-assembly lipoprotein
MLNAIRALNPGWVAMMLINGKRIKPCGSATGPKARYRGRPTGMLRMLVALLPTAMLVSGCGFQLEGAGRLPEAMSRTFVDTAEPHSEFFGSLRETLRLRGSDVVERRGDAGAVLTIVEDTTGQRVLSVSSRNIPREYEIYYIVTFTLTAGEQRLIEPESLVVTRSYTYDEREVLGKAEEERTLRRALAEDLARQVVRRIEALGVSAGQVVPHG